MEPHFSVCKDAGTNKEPFQLCAMNKSVFCGFMLDF